MKNIHILPTDKPSKVYKNEILDLGFLKGESVNTYPFCISHNIYITSDEGIKKGDWVFLPSNEIYKMSNTDMIHYLESESKSTNKIILTTDQDLIKDGVQAIDDEFLEWFVKNPSCEFVEVENHYRVKSGTIREHLDGVAGYEYYEYKIIIPQEKTKQETLEEAAERLYPYEVGYGVFDRNCEIDVERERFIKGAKWQQERSYSEEEVLEILLNCPTNTEKETKEWFEQFKKK